jgi:hypothetical protein
MLLLLICQILLLIRKRKDLIDSTVVQNIYDANELLNVYYESSVINAVRSRFLLNFLYSSNYNLIYFLYIDFNQAVAAQMRKWTYCSGNLFT